SRRSDRTRARVTALRVCTLLLLLGAAGCTRAASGPASAARHPWTIPETLRAAMVANPKTLNPLLSTQNLETMAEAFIFDPLIATDHEGRDYPVLASIVPTLENGGISKDGLTITYHLRHGVRWQDNAPFTSRDVRFSFDAVMNDNTAVVSRHGYDDVAKIETPDAYTVVLHLKQPFAPAVHTFFATSDTPYMILPAHLLARYSSLDGIAFNSHPIGTGPFRFVRWVRGDRIEYVANDDYFLGRPKLRRIILHIVPDENTIANELRSHEIDWFIQATPRTYPQIKGIPGIDVRLVDFNGNDSMQINVTKPPLDDPRVRLAVGLAIDKRELVDKVTFGTTVPAKEDLPAFMWASDPTAGEDSRDLPRARALLDAAGWKMGNDGIRHRDGVRLTFDLAFRMETVTDRDRGVLIVAMLRDAGIDVRLKGYNTSMLYATAAQNGVMASGRFQAALTDWYAGVDPDDSSQLMCDQLPPNGWNWSRYCSSQMDAAQRVALSHYDRATRKAAYSKIEHLLARDTPFVYLWWPRQIEAINDDLKNFRPNGIIENWNAYQWSI
ncbi:MAG TPA: peptide ABC transporter substrate-binding protein, partial [Candidatus Acidoferrales bacterium]|nr:peptide ABC transporter substrate-binding protein [Candidatus Acidoferrales bacterium]